MTKPEEICCMPSVDVQCLKRGAWVHVKCRVHSRPIFDGTFYAGGAVVGVFHGFAECYECPVLVIIDPVLHDKPYFIRLCDILFAKEEKLSVLND